MAFRDGLPVFAQPGAPPSDPLTKVIDAVRAPDMDEVRRDLAERAAA